MKHIMSMITFVVIMVWVNLLIIGVLSMFGSTIEPFIKLDTDLIVVTCLVALYNKEN